MNGGGARLWLDGVTVSFDGFRALDGLSLAIDAGELRCVIGPNGAGKTTMMDVITGRTRPDAGAVFLADDDQTELTRLREHEIVRRGVGRKLQRPTVFAQLTVLENLELAARRDRGVWAGLFRRLAGDEGAQIERALSIIGMSERASAPAGGLSHGEKQWLEIGMLLAQDPRVLLVDEPVAGMTHEESARTAELLVGLAGAHTVVVVEHDMDFVRAIARRVTVLHEGRVLAEGTMQDVQADPRVIQVYLGDSEAAAC